MGVEGALHNDDRVYQQSAGFSTARHTQRGTRRKNRGTWLLTVRDATTTSEEEPKGPSLFLPLSSSLSLPLFLSIAGLCVSPVRLESLPTFAQPRTLSIPLCVCVAVARSPFAIVVDRWCLLVALPALEPVSELRLLRPPDVLLCALSHGSLLPEWNDRGEEMKFAAFVGLPSLSSFLFSLCHTHTHT